MRDYYEISVTIDPWQEESAELIIAEIESLGFESFLLEEPLLKAYIPVDIFDKEILEEALDCPYEMNRIEYENWNAKWESEFEPVIIDDRCVIKASFHNDVPQARYNITIDPKMAFGTGHHNTTALMIEAMFSEDFSGKRVLDMGSGTGILAILAAMMGASSVEAIDIDPVAVDSIEENIVKNSVKERVLPACGDASLLGEREYDTILANINRNILMKDINIYSSVLKSGGLLLISGFYEEDSDMLLNEAEKWRLYPVEKKSRERWTIISLKKR